MRLTGRAGSARGPRPRGHACCLHDHAAEHRRRPAAFFTEGLRAGLRVAHASPDGPVDAAALVLTRPRPGVEAGALAVDLAGVAYVDQRVLLALGAYARAHGGALTLRSAPPFAARLMELLPAASLQCAELEATP